jgi:hypothetical protein
MPSQPLDGEHETAEIIARQLDDAFFDEHPDEYRHERRAVPHEVCQALIGGAWCRNPLDDLPAPPSGMRLVLVVIVTRSAGADGARTKQFRAVLEPIDEGPT